MPHSLLFVVPCLLLSQSIVPQSPKEKSIHCAQEILDQLAADFQNQSATGATKDQIINSFQKIITQYCKENKNANPWHPQKSIIRPQIGINEVDSIDQVTAQTKTARDATIFGEIVCAVFFDKNQKNPSICCIIASVLTNNLTETRESEIKLLEMQMKSKLNNFGGYEIITNSRLCDFQSR